MTNMKSTPVIPVQVTVSDPNNVSETLITGPINLQIGPEISLIMFSALKPNMNLLMQGRVDPNPRADIVFKAALPTSALRAFSASLGQALNTQSLMASGANPNGGIIVPGGDGNH